MFKHAVPVVGGLSLSFVMRVGGWHSCCSPCPVELLGVHILCIFTICTAPTPAGHTRTASTGCVSCLFPAFPLCVPLLHHACSAVGASMLDKSPTRRLLPAAEGPGCLCWAGRRALGDEFCKSNGDQGRLPPFPQHDLPRVPRAAFPWQMCAPADRVYSSVVEQAPAER